ncbi:MAG: hypothetical protein LLF76_09645 [Planctomycetaceae bacterium]|nr:hypothetical protein [Planctomycetaceae bacterium]
MRFMGESTGRAILNVFICLCFFASVSIVFSQEESIPHQVKEWQQAGEQCKRQGNYDCACANHQNIVDSYPQTDYAFQSLYHLALLHIKYGNNTLADQAIQNLLSDYAGHEEIDTRIRRIAASYLDVNQPSQARQLCQTQLLNCQNRAEAAAMLSVLAIAQIQLGEYAESESISHKIIDEYNDEAEAWKSIRNIATAYFAASQFTKAKELCHLSLSTWPNHPEEIFTLSDLVMNDIRLRDYNGAENATALLLSRYRGLQMDNKSSKTKVARLVQKIADAYLEFNLPLQARQIYEWLLEQDPGQRSAWTTEKMVQVFTGLGDPNKAQTEMELLFSAYSEPVDQFLTAVVDLQKYLLKKQLYVKGLELGDRALALYPEHEKGAWVQMNNIDSIMNLNGPENVAYGIGMFQDLSAASPDPKVQIRCAEGIGKGYVRLDSDAGVQEQIDLLYTRYLTDYPKEAASSMLDIGEEYYWSAQRAATNKDTESAAAAYKKGIDVFNGALPNLPNARIRCMASYMTGLNYWQLKQWYPAATSFLAAIEADPHYEYAGPMHWMISHCYEKLRDEDAITANEADPIIEWGYKTLFEDYPSESVVEYAAIRLAQIYLAQGKPVSAAVYINWFLDTNYENDEKAGIIRRILQGLEGCGK